MALIVLESTAVSAKERPGKPVKNPSIPDGLSPIFAESPLKKNSAIVESIGDVINNFIKTFKTLMSSRLKKATESIFVQTLRCRGWWYEIVQV